MSEQAHTDRDIHETMAELAKFSQATRKKIDAEISLVMKRLNDLSEEVRK